MAAPGRPGAIVSEEVDLALAGAISIAIFWPLVVLGFPGGLADLPPLIASRRLEAEVLWLSALLNMPHFFASYWLVYRSREMVLRHRWASIYLPALVAVWCITSVGLSAAGISQLGIHLVFYASAAYLAWHYTGQAWGMMVSFSILDGVPFSEGERRWLRTSLRILLAWHVVWVLHLQTEFRALQEIMTTAYPILTAGIGVSFAIGATGLIRMRRRIGRWPPARILVPWIAIYFWYLLMARYPFAIVLVQLAHAVQYLPFPFRVEFNRARAAAPAPPRRTLLAASGVFALALPLFFLVPQLFEGFRLPFWIAEQPSAVMGTCAVLLLSAWLLQRLRPVAARMLSLAVVILVGGCSLFWFLSAFVTQGLVQLLDSTPEKLGTIQAVSAFLNIHHYFTDGVLWKLSNPQVRRDLFAHVAR